MKSILTIFLLLTGAVVSAPGLARAQDGAPIDDVPRTVEIGLEFYAGWANAEFFNSAQGGAGLAFRVKDVVTFRLRSQFFGVDDPGPAPGAPDDAYSATMGLVIHPFKFYNGQIPNFWIEPYMAADVGMGTLFDSGDSTEFLQANFLWGVNFDIGRPVVLFFEGGVLYLDFDDKDPHRNSAVQGQMQGGIRYFF